MHPLSRAAYQASMGYPGMDAGGQQQSPPEAGSPNTHHDPTNGGADQNAPPSNYTDINQILDQILNITDQSLDEAQVNGQHFFVFFYTLNELFSRPRSRSGIPQ